MALIDSLEGFDITARIRPRVPDAGLIGHSMMDQALSRALSGTANRIVILRAMIAQHLDALSKGRWRFPERAALAVSGWTSAQILNTKLDATSAPLNPAAQGKTQAEAMIAANVGIALGNVVHNDRTNNLTLQQSKDNTLAITDALCKGGVMVGMLSSSPVGNATFTGVRFSADNLLAHLAYRDWLLNEFPDQFPGMAYGIDVWAPLQDRSAGAMPGDIGLAYTSDGVHKSSAGGYEEARAVRRVMGDPAYGRPPRLGVRGDNYDATKNPTGNLLKGNANMLDAGTAMSGTAGGVTLAGVRPSAWNVAADTNLQGGTGITVTGSMVDLPNGRWWQARVQGAAGASGGTLAIGSVSLTLADLVAGDRIAPYLEFEVDQGGTGFAALATQLRAVLPNSENNRVLINEADSANRSWDTILAQGKYEGIVNGDVGLVVTKNETDVNLSFLNRITPNATLDFTFRMREPAVRKGAVA